MIFHKECQGFNQNLPGIPGYKPNYWILRATREKRDKPTSDSGVEMIRYDL